MTSKRIPVQHNEVIRLNPAQNALDLSYVDHAHSSHKEPKEAPLQAPKHHHIFDEKISLKTRYTLRSFVTDIRTFWHNSYGTIRAYLTPEEASRERIIFVSALALVFFLSLSFLGITQAMRFVHISHAEQVRLQALPATISDIIVNRRVTELPRIFQSINEFLTTLDTFIAPGTSAVHANGSLLHQVSLVRQSARALTDAGNSMTPVMTSILVFAQDMKDLTPDALRQKYGSLTDYVALQWKVLIEHAYPQLRIAQSKLMQVNVDQLPAQMQDEIRLLRDIVNDAVRIIATLDTHMPAVLSLLGSDTPRTYAVLLQNSGEMRATGGFIGSMAMVKINDGWIEYLRFRDVYDVDGQIFDDVPPPPGIETISRSFRLRDSNYWPDFPTSAKQAAWFLDKDKGPGIDGVFAISDELIVRLLEATGPVVFDGLKQPVAAENFMALMSFIVESKQDKEQPKSVVFRFAEAFVPKLTATLVQNPLKMEIFAKSIQERLILGYAFDPAIQAFFEDAGISGNLYVPLASTTGVVMDYFMPVFTATGGNKSDRYIEQQITHDSRVTEEGVLQNQVSLIRRHTWNDATEKHIRSMVRETTGLEISDRVLEILGAERNRHYVRFFVPRGAVLDAVEGMERGLVKVSEDLGMTVFGFEMSVPMGQETRVKFTYHLPDKLSPEKEVSYFLVMQKQPGGDAIPVTKTMTPTSEAVIMADTNGYSVLDDDASTLALDMKPQEISLSNIWHGGYLLRMQ